MKRLRIFLKRFVSGLAGGSYRSSEIGSGGYELREIKEFRPGDDFSAIHLLTSVKRGNLFQVLREPEKAARFLFLMDLSRSGKFGSSEVSKEEIQTSLLTILAESGAEGTNQIGLLAFTSRIENFWKPYVGLSKILSRIKRAAGFKDLGRGTDLLPAIDFVLKLKSRPDLVILCSDFLAEENYKEALMRLKSKSDIICLLVRDPKEIELVPPRGGVIAVRDLEGRNFGYVSAINSEWPGEKLLRELNIDYEIFLTSDNGMTQWQKLHRLFEKRRIAGVRLK